MEAKSRLLSTRRFVILCLAIACQCQIASSKVSANTTWSIRAVVVNPYLAPNSIMLRHDDIEGLMPAMTMPFGVVSRSMLEGVEYRDLVEIEFRKIEGHFVIHELKKIASADIAKSNLRTDGENHTATIPWNIELIDSRGKPITLQKYRQGTIIVNFIYTRCPTVCPLQTARLQSVLEQIGLEYRDHSQFVSISLDPENDSPEKMSQYAKSRGIDTQQWSFLTGSSDAVNRVLNSFNVVAMAQSDVDINHSQQVFVIQPGGEMFKAYSNTSETLVEVIYRDITLLSDANSGMLD